MKWSLIPGVVFLFFSSTVAQQSKLDSMLIDHVIMKEYDEAVGVLEKGAGPLNPLYQQYAALHYSLMVNRTDFFTLMVQYGAHPSDPPTFFPPVWTATAHGNYRFLMLLQRAGWDLKYADGSGVNVTSFAVKYDRPQELKYLFDQGVGAAHTSGQTNLLQRAAASNAYQCVPLLLAQGMDPELVSPNGNTALSIAVKAGHSQVLGAMLEGSDVDWSWRNEKGLTLLHLALENDCGGCVEELVRNGAPVMVPDGKGDFPIHAATQKGDLRVISALMGGQLDLNVPDSRGRSPFFISVVSHHALAAQLLLMNGARDDANMVSDALEAVLRHDLSTLKQLVPNADAANATPTGLPLLHWAVRANAPDDLIQWLLEAGADPNLRDCKGRSLFFPLILRNRHELISLFPSLSPNPELRQASSAMALAAQLDRPEILRYLLEEEGERFPMSEDGWSLLEHAIGAYASRPTLEVALEYSPDHILMGIPKVLNTPVVLNPLATAVDHPDQAVFEWWVKWYLERMPDILSTPELAEAPVLAAVRSNRPDRLAFLLDNGFPANVGPAKQLALEELHLDCYRMLIRSIRASN